ncbi:MAG: tetratricopeptide repeat protein [Mariprofundales bacterium]|nr:tetratricopeptide repeat protein [Mariprofundales bacterium]
MRVASPMRWLLLALCLTLPVVAGAANAPAPQWVQQGWLALHQHGLDAGIAVWQRGVDGLPSDQRLLLSVGVFHDPLRAGQEVERLGIGLRGIVLKGRHHGSTAYFVLSAPSPHHLESMRSDIGALVYGDGRRIYGWSVDRFQPGGSFALPAVVAIAPLRIDRAVPVEKSPASVARGPEVTPVAVHHAVPHATKLHSQPSTPVALGAAGHPDIDAVVRAKVRPPLHSQGAWGVEYDAQVLFAQAKRAQALGQRKQAIALLHQLLLKTPQHARARLLSGQLMIKDGQYDAAWQVLQPLLRPDLLDWKPWFWSGTAELMVGRLDAAANHFDEALARDGRVAAVWVQRALVAQQRGHFAVAYQLLKVAEARAPKSSQVILNLGYTLDAMGHRQQASRYYQRYLVQTAGASSQWKVRKAVLKRLTALNSETL